jgi:hypothetical protein
MTLREWCLRDLAVLPGCGAPNIHLHFAREAALVRHQVELADNLASEQSELAYRLMGNAHEDVLTAIEATLKTVYLYKVASRPVTAARCGGSKARRKRLSEHRAWAKAFRGIQLRSVRGIGTGRSIGADAQYSEAPRDWA